MTLIQVDHLQFNYDEKQAFSLDISNFSVNKGQRLFLEGPSGCGKTTFLNLLTGLLKPTSGSIRILDTDITKLSHTQCDRFRADHFGIIFQMFNLIPYLSVLENITLPCMFSTQRKQKVLQFHDLETEALRLCETLQIEKSLLSKPVQALSIGQQQRVAIARALIGQPEIIIADEPTSALDDSRKTAFMTELLRACEKLNTTLLFVSHDASLKSYFDTVASLNALTEPQESLDYELV